MSAYLVNRDGQELGSFELPQIKSGLATGQFQASDWGWQEGMAEWQPLSALAGSPAAAFAPKPQASAPRPAMAAAPINPYASPSAAQVRTLGSPIVSGAVPPDIVVELAGTKPWVRLISVLMWIGCGLALLVLSIQLLGALMGASALAERGNAGIGIVGLVITLVLGFLSALLVVYPTLKLSKYASNISRLVETKSFTDLSAALREQRRFWKFYGILVAIYLCLILIVFLLGLTGAGLSFLAR